MLQSVRQFHNFTVTSHFVASNLYWGTAHSAAHGNKWQVFLTADSKCNYAVIFWKICRSNFYNSQSFVNLEEKPQLCMPSNQN